MAKVNFSVAKKLATYTAIEQKDVNTLYFVLDAKKIYKGDVDVTSNLEVVTSFDSDEAGGNINLGDAFEGKLYLNATTFEMRVKNGAAWSVLSPGYLTTGGEYAQADNDHKLGTIGVIKTIIGQAIAAINTSVSYDNTTGTLTVNGSTARLTGVINGITYSPEQLQLTVKSIAADGSPTSQVISLPKDNFVRSGSYDSESQEIVLVVNDGDEGESQEVRIPAASLVDVYTGATSQNITVNVSEGNVITATAIIDPVEGNALISGESGLKVDISGKANTVVATDGNIILAKGDGQFKDGGITVLSDGVLGSSNTQIPVASVIATAISTAVSAAQGTLEAAIAALEENVGEIEGRVATLESFQSALTGKYLTSSIAENFVGFADTSGNIKDSGKKAGSATLSSVPDTNTLATEAAVAAAISWQELA